jgi:broad specificity phosphatase PhoE
MNLFLIRHAQTDYAKERRYYSFSDIALNQDGINQAVSLQKKLANSKPDFIFSSPSKRAYKTAEIIFPDKEIISSRSLQELNFGLWEGLTFVQICENHQTLYDNWLRDPYKYGPPEGEMLPDLEKRTRQFLHEIYEEDENKTIVCVSHAGPIKAMICYLLDKNFHDFWATPVDLASVSYFKIKNKKVISYNLNNL